MEAVRLQRGPRCSQAWEKASVVPDSLEETLEGDGLEEIIDTWVTWETFSPYLFCIPTYLAK